MSSSVLLVFWHACCLYLLNCWLSSNSSLFIACGNHFSTWIDILLADSFILQGILVFVFCIHLSKFSFETTRFSAFGDLCHSCVCPFFAVGCALGKRWSRWTQCRQRCVKNADLRRVLLAHRELPSQQSLRGSHNNESIHICPPHLFIRCSTAAVV